MDKKLIEMVGEYTWRIPCKDNEHAGFEITINSGKPTTPRPGVARGSSS